MRISCRPRCREEWPLPEALPAVREVGYGAVELCWAQVEQEFADTRDVAAGVRALLEAHGLTLSGMNVADLAAIGADAAGDAVQIIRQQMERARALGLSSVNVQGGDRRTQSPDVFLLGLNALLGEAEKLDMTICLANARGTRIEQIEDLRRVFLAVRHPCLRVLNDAGEFHLAAVNPRDVIAEFGDRMSLMRISDWMGRRLVLPGEGQMNVPAVIEQARAGGYDGWIVVDAHGQDAAGALRYLGEARPRLEAMLAADA